MKRHFLAAAWGSAFTLILGGVSQAQIKDPSPASTESVTVTGQTLPHEEVIRSFVETSARAAPALNKMAKWARGLCLITVGLPPSYNILVTKRVRHIADLAGAPLLNEAGCQPNIDIVFTREPQILLDRIREEHPVLLGFHNASEENEISKVRLPIQAWYATETEDEHGLRQIDNPQDRHGSDMIIPAGANPACPRGCTWNFPNARTMTVSGSRITDSLRSQFYHVLIVVDLDKINGLKTGSLADYIAMRALTQPQKFDQCLAVPSITNLMSPDCSAKTDSIADIDMAYLRAVYSTDTAKIFSSQKREIADKMMKALAAH